MSQPLLATHRLTLQYVVSGFTHSLHAYCKRHDPLLGGVGVENRDGTLTALDDAAQGLWDAFKDLMGEHVPPPSAMLEELSGTLWFPVAGATVTGAAGSASPSSLASQYTLVVRDTAFKKIRLVIMEAKFGYVGHSPNGLGITAQTDELTHAYNGVGLGAHDPFMWQKSRGDRYILASGAIAGGTFDLNDKLKRRRGLE